MMRRFYRLMPVIHFGVCHEAHAQDRHPARKAAAVRSICCATDGRCVALEGTQGAGVGRMHTCSNPLEKGEPVSRLAPTHTQITRPRAEALRREGERKNSVLAEMTQCVRSQGKQGAVGGGDVFGDAVAMPVMMVMVMPVSV